MDMHDRIMTLRLQKPFTPFRIRLADGNSVEVTERMSFAVGQSSLIVARAALAGLHVRFEDIASIDVLAPTA